MNNCILIILDSCRYDNFKKANTPNMDSIGELQRVYSNAGYTAPSLHSIFMNMPFYNQYEEFSPSNRLFSTVRNPLFPSLGGPSWLPSYLQKRGYRTVLITTNPWVVCGTRNLTIGFDNVLGYDLWSDHFKDCCFQEVMLSADLVKSFNKTPLFLVHLLMETHVPYYEGDQVKGAEYNDLVLSTLFNRLKEHKFDSEVVICADHGDNIGDVRGKNHAPIETDFHYSIFEVPLIRGVIKRNERCN